MTRGKVVSLCVVALACPLLLLGPGAATRPSVTGIFSDMYFSPEGGDVVGTEVFIMYTNKGYYATFQVSEGVPSVPALVRVSIDGVNVSFSVPDEQGGGVFRGHVTPDALVGAFDGGRGSLTLKRGKSHWQ